MDKEITPRGITLTLTENCNLKCTYCYEHNKSTKTMSFETARDIIDKELGSNVEGPVTIDFFGGEPFLEFELMHDICEYTWKKDWGREYKFFVSKNGTIMPPYVKSWLEFNKERFWCGLSYDGTKAMQDTNRDNSSRLIDLDFFSRNWPNQGVKMTVSKETLPNLAEGVIFLHGHGFNVNCNLAYGPDWSDNDWDEVLQNQLLILIEFYLSHPKIQPCSMLDMEIKFVSQYKTMGYSKWCGAGTNMKVYAPDGICYPCHFFEPLSVGDCLAKKSLNIDFSKAVQLMDKDCEGCCLLPICPTCYGSNYAATGDITKKDKDLCRLTKVQALANSFFKYKKLTSYTDEELGISIEDRKMLTDAIIYIQNMF